MRQMAALGQVDSVEKILEARLSKSNRERQAGGDFSTIGIEFKAHGFREAGIRNCARAAEWFATRPSNARNRLRGELAMALACAERWDEARQIYQELLAADSLNHNVRGAVGAAAFHVGDLAAADAVDRFLVRYEGDPNAVFGRAVLAALRGDREVALRHLQWAWDHGISWGRLHLTTTSFDSLRTDPRFKAMLHSTR